MPFFDHQAIPLSRILTDRGTEYGGATEQHENELYLEGEHIEHTRTKPTRPQTNGIGEQVHKTLLNEFYRVAFCKTIDHPMVERRADWEVWLTAYNTEPPHQGRECYGKPPMETVVDRVP